MVIFKIFLLKKYLEDYRFTSLLFTTINLIAMNVVNFYMNF